MGTKGSASTPWIRSSCLSASIPRRLAVSPAPQPRSAPGCVPTAAGLLSPPFLAASVPLIVAFLMSDLGPHHLTRMILFEGPSDVFSLRGLPVVAGTVDLQLLGPLGNRAPYLSGRYFGVSPCCCCFFPLPSDYRCAPKFRLSLLTCLPSHPKGAHARVEPSHLQRWLPCVLPHCPDLPAKPRFFQCLRSICN